MTWKRAAIVLGMMGVAAASGGLAACQSSPWDEDPRRSQYDDYHRIRGDHRDDHTRNRFGGEEVNLRERLKPLDDGAM
jgi:hypothetical protein